MYNMTGELRRVESVLTNLGNKYPDLRTYTECALSYNQYPCKTAFYTCLRDIADYLNPYKPSDPRRLKKCMIAAFARKEHQAALAATFYLLSEGLYNQPHLPDLTKTH